MSDIELYLALQSIAGHTSTENDIVRQALPGVVCSTCTSILGCRDMKRWSNRQTLTLGGSDVCFRA